MKVKVYPYRHKVGMGNILWQEKHPMRNGRFPPDHPVGGKFAGVAVRGSSALTQFRERGYWASCFPEGDGITWKPLNGQSDAQCLADIAECFGWELEQQGPWDDDGQA